MDGIVIMVVAASMQQVCDALPEPINSVEEAMLNEIFLKPFDAVVLPRADAFAKAVTEPSKKFVAHWGGAQLTTCTLQAMCSGGLADLKRFFDERTGTTCAW